MGIMIILLIMSTMHTNRKTNKEFVQNIEEELNRFSLTSTIFYAKSDNVDPSQEYIVPEDGWYKIGLWGACGVFSNKNYIPRGAYTSGVIKMKAGKILYFYVGKQGDEATGAGKGKGTGKNGGGATEVRLAKGGWKDNASLESRIMVAAGGGGYAADGNVDGYGGSVVGNNSRKVDSTTGISQVVSYGGLQTGGSFGVGGKATVANTGGGGGGYYGGSAGISAGGSGAGGSSYISGYAGVYTKGKTNEGATYVNQDDATNAYDNVFINGVIIPGARYGYSEMYNGVARISKVSDYGTAPAILNSDIYNNNGAGIQYVRDCISGLQKADSKQINADISIGSDSESFKESSWKELQVIDGTAENSGKNVAYGRKYIFTDYNGNWSGTGSTGPLTDGKIAYNSAGTTASSEGKKCVIVNLEANYKYIREVAVWHSFDEWAYVPVNHTLSVSSNGTDWCNVATNNNADSFAIGSNETGDGFHYSAWQPKSTGKPVDGIYYIMSASSNAFFLSDPIWSTDGAKFNSFNGYANQKWIFKSLGEDYFQITNLATGRVLEISYGTDSDDAPIELAESDTISDWNKWTVENAGNGMVYIKSGYGTCMGIDPDFSHSQNLLFYNWVDFAYSKKKISPSGKLKNALQVRSQKFRILAANY